MFVCSLKSSVIKKVFAVILAASVITAAAVLLCNGSASGEAVSAAEASAVIEYKAADNSERLAFISQFGWEVSQEPLEVREIIIPEDFDEVYEKYNALQLSQGLDLSEYAGKRVKRWTYVITNYPDMPENDGTVRINMLVYKNTVIGGDVCSIKLDGFMHGFMKE